MINHLIVSPANLWMWCVLAGHNPDEAGKCRRCGEQADDE